MSDAAARPTLDRLAILGVAFAVGTLAACFAIGGSRANAPSRFPTPAALGEALFMDTNLSRNRTQACATCHDPSAGFADPRKDGAGGAVSRGDDGQSLGTRNAPTASYASFAPEFRRTADGAAVGGLFHDGRAATLEAQAGGPPLNPAEMGMPDKASLLQRVLENADYAEALGRLYGPEARTDPEAGFKAVTRSIAAFERTDVFAPFDSKYDRFLRGEEKLNDQEELGRVLFFSTQFANCSQCHQLQPLGGAARETFSNYRFRNIGTPPNPAIGAPDRGLEGAAAGNAPSDRGLIKVPTLRNVAVTGPYMHNGVFRGLRTVIAFYNHFVSKSPKRQINPETGAHWGDPPFPETLARKELTAMSALDDKRIDALVAFLRTLTDRRYEHLLEN